MDAESADREPVEPDRHRPRRDAPDGPVPLGHQLERICAGVLSGAAVDGAGITVMGSLDGGLRGARDQVVAMGDLAGRLEELQLTAGEGPCLDAFATGTPVLVADLAAELARWPGFAPDALAAGAAAVFSLPLQVGAVRLGTLDLYRARPGRLSRPQLAGALEAADAATEAVLQDPDPVGEGGDDVGWLPGAHTDVHIASGMVSARTGMDIGSALLRLRGYAFAHGEPLHAVARRVIDRTLDLTDHSTTDDAPAPGRDRRSAPDPEDDCT